MKSFHDQQAQQHQLDEGAELSEGEVDEVGKKTLNRRQMLSEYNLLLCVCVLHEETCL